MEREDKYMDEYAMIIKRKIVPFICASCGYSFDKAIYVFSENDGNYYFNCPRCGADCHVDVNDEVEHE